MQRLKIKLQNRIAEGSFRRLRLCDGLVDFCSNDYLGLARSPTLKDRLSKQFQESNESLGSTGSRLVSGNDSHIENLESFLSHFHEAEAGLLFNSGYDANLGLFSAVASRGDTILYDKLSHASIRDGIRLSFASSYSFAHNNLAILESKLKRAKGNIFIAVESVYSMDGDFAPLEELSCIAQKYNACLIVDEAHSTGIFGKDGQGLICELGLQEKVFARVHTFGKAIGCHGAIVVGSQILRDYLINFARPFIYSTALPPHSINAIKQAYQFSIESTALRQKLFENISLFRDYAADIPGIKLQPATIQTQILPGNENVKLKSEVLAAAGFDIRPIMSPTVAKGEERLRICLHSYNSEKEIVDLTKALSA